MIQCRYWIFIFAHVCIYLYVCIPPFSLTTSFTRMCPTFCIYLCLILSLFLSLFSLPYQHQRVALRFLIFPLPLSLSLSYSLHLLPISPPPWQYARRTQDALMEIQMDTYATCYYSIGLYKQRVNRQPFALDFISYKLYFFIYASVFIISTYYYLNTSVYVKFNCF